MTLLKLTKGRRITHTERDRLIDKVAKRYKKGASICILADRPAAPTDSSISLLREADIELRSRGGTWRTRRRPSTGAAHTATRYQRTTTRSGCPDGAHHHGVVPER